jgi:glycosyltransferase involved in cell wall biosynthesis
LFRPLLQIDIGKIKREEEFFWKKANALVAVSREEQDIMNAAGCKPFLVPNGVNTKKFTFKNIQEKNEEKEKRILFMGDFTWIQNQDTVKFIIKEIWPLIKQKRASNNLQEAIKLWIVGRKIPNSIHSLTNDSDVLFDEGSSSLPTEKIFHKASLLLAPIRVGGGTSYKILESMSSGTPVVTMKLSADALGAKDGKDCFVGQNAEELAEKTLQLLQDDKLYQIVSKNGRDLVEKNYTWAEIGKKLEEVYQSAVVY